MAAVVLPPREVAVEKADVDGRHFLRAVVVRSAEIPGAEKAEDRLRRRAGLPAGLIARASRLHER